MGIEWVWVCLLTVVLVVIPIAFGYFGAWSAEKSGGDSNRQGLMFISGVFAGIFFEAFAATVFVAVWAIFRFMV